MIKIALAAELIVIVFADAAVAQGPSGLVATAERPDAVRADHMVVRATGVACADATWPHYPADCFGRRPVRIVPGIRTAVDPVADKRI
jgi:hypothetical protein